MNTAFPLEEELRVAEEQLRWDMEDLGLSCGEVNAILAMMTVGEQHPLIRYGQRIGVVSPGVPNGREKLKYLRRKCCHRTSIIHPRNSDVGVSG